MMELCDIFDSDKVKEELLPDRLCEEPSYLGFFGKAGLRPAAASSDISEEFSGRTAS